ncbi:MAG TPA: sensor histidine kinase [Streptosporangiaceae bacterium]|nr:sensor histidine kinase [Streptosporangiaceae bacterium]
MSGGSSRLAEQVHETGFYGSDAEFRALIVPFAVEGIAAGQPVILGYDQRKTGLLRSWLSNPSGVTFIGDQTLYATPTGAIAAYRKLFAGHVAAGATQIRIAGDVPHEGNGGSFEGWDRYESAVNTVWDDFPVRSRCLYDISTAAPQVLDTALRTHPCIVAPSGERRLSGRYQDPSVFEALPPLPDPLEQSAPAVHLVEPSTAQARRAVTATGRGHIPEPRLEELGLGVSEAVSNARGHGRPPVTLRIWAAPGRIVVHVHDTGPGPASPLAGMIPAAAAPSLPGAGLWLIHMLGLHPALIRSGDGFTLRLRTTASEVR